MSHDPDAPETLHDFLDRMYWNNPQQQQAEFLPWGLSREERECYGETLGDTWERLEREKAARRKEKTRMTEREQREAQRLAEREEREEKRKREQLEAEERRDPTPTIHPPEYEVEIPYAIRDQHVFVPGGTRRGKSSVLLSMIMGDIENGEGVAVFDPKGTLIPRICYHLPPTRQVDGETREILDDCVYLDLRTPIPLDFMGHKPSEENTLISELLYIVTKGDANLTAAGPLLKRALRSLLQIEGASFLDAYRFFTKPKRQQDVLDQLEKINPELARSWNPRPTYADYRAITTRMDDFYWNPTLSTIFGSANAILNINQLMDEKRILLVDLSPPSDDNSLYGSLLVSKFQQAALRRSGKLESEQIPYYLYIDEFEFFQTKSFATIFSVAGRLGLRLTIGNQYLGQLTSDILGSVLGNAGTYIFFQLGPQDTGTFSDKIAPYKDSRLAQLEQYQAVFKVAGKPPIFKWTKKPYQLTDEDIKYARAVVQRLRENTIARYGKDACDAQNGPIRPGDKPSSHTEKTVSEIGKDDNFLDDKDDRPHSIVLPDEPKDKGPQGAR